MSVFDQLLLVCESRSIGGELADRFEEALAASRTVELDERARREALQGVDD